MARVSTPLNFARCTERAFNCHRSGFGGGFSGGIHWIANCAAND